MNDAWGSKTMPISRLVVILNWKKDMLNPGEFKKLEHDLRTKFFLTREHGGAFQEDEHFYSFITVPRKPEELHNEASQVCNFLVNRYPGNIPSITVHEEVGFIGRRFLDTEENTGLLCQD